MSRLVFVLLATITVAALASPEEDTQRQSDREAATRAKDEANIAAWRKRCTSFGYKEGSETFANCVQGESKAYEARVRDQKAREEKASRNLNCVAGNKDQCDNKPTTTNCTRDFLGNLSCTTQ